MQAALASTTQPQAQPQGQSQPPPLQPAGQSPKKARGRPPKQAGSLLAPNSLPPPPQPHLAQAHPAASLAIVDPSLSSGPLPENGAPQQSTSLSHIEREKLIVVLQSLDTTGALELGMGGSTLRESLASPHSSITDLINTVSFLPAPSSFTSTALNLLNDLARRTPRGTKRPAQVALALPPSKKKFMLHRSLPTQDIFAGPAELDEDDLAQLAEVEDTDVIAVVDSTQSVPVVPRLGDVNPRPRYKDPPHSSRPLLPIPVDPLYYDCFSSFAPSYDSSAATLSYLDSVAFRTSRDLLLSHETASAAAAAPRPPPLPAPLPVPSLDPDIDVATLEREGWIQNARVEMRRDGELERNRTRIRELVRLQRERLRASRPEVGAVLGGRKVEAKTGPEEARTARELLTSFTSLLAQAPPGSLIPGETVRLATPLVLAHHTQDRSYSGSLDPQNSVAVRESRMSRPLPDSSTASGGAGGANAYAQVKMEED